MLLILNHITSICLVTACWWLAHQHSARRNAKGKSMALLYGLLGLSVLLTMFFRQLASEEVVSWSLNITKIVLTIILVLKAKTFEHRY